MKNLNQNNNDMRRQLNEEKKRNLDLINELNIEKKKVFELTNEINKLKLKLGNDNPISFKPGEKMFGINFISANKDLQRPMGCKNTDIICKLEEKVYNEYPIYKDKNTYLTVNGRIIKRFKSLEENNIKDGDTIIINQYKE